MGSSETIRRNFSVKKLFMKNIQFCTYLTGLIEGDGTIVVPKERVSKNNTKNYPSVEICFYLKDLPLCLTIQKIYNIGSVSRKKGVNAYTITINSKQGILFIVSLLNGYMRSAKIYDLWKLIDWLNSEKTDKKIPKHEKDKSSLLSNAWLSGFIEATGHFSVRATLRKIECKFEIEQSIIDHNNNSSLCILEKIGNTLDCSVKMVRKTKPKKQYRVRTTNLKGNTTLEEYLKEYPLFGSKFLDFQDWLIVLYFFKRKVHKKIIFYHQIERIKSGMNLNRKNFQWNHLNNFYHLEK
uniref:Homing endonuclease LAGLIDADG domain-containing protein n=1 Tax=Trebouxia lynnae TaxID=1825957 RepID=A0A5J6DTM7_9CHLO|nr:hypothetical protein [Trebouxia lynnae]